MAGVSQHEETGPQQAGAGVQQLVTGAQSQGTSVTQPFFLRRLNPLNPLKRLFFLDPQQLPVEPQLMGAGSAQTGAGAGATQVLQLLLNDLLRRRSNNDAFLMWAWPVSQAPVAQEASTTGADTTTGAVLAPQQSPLAAVVDRSRTKKFTR
jgi:hypothetical protein